MLLYITNESIGDNMGKLTSSFIEREGIRKSVVLKRNDGKELILRTEGNGDLYFTLKYLEGNQDSTFIIGLDNYEIYESFDKLFKCIAFVNVFSKDKINENLKKDDHYKKIYHDGFVEWICDEYPVEIAPFFKIEKIENAYVLTFFPKKLEDRFENIISVRLSTSGSRYGYFYKAFVDCYRDLCGLPKYHQVHINEFLLDKMFEGKNEEECKKLLLSKRLNKGFYN